MERNPPPALGQAGQKAAAETATILMSLQDLSVIFAGAGEFGLPSLRAIVSAGAKAVQVVSQPDRPAGRGRKLTPTAISQFAIENNLPLIRTLDINAETLPPAD